MTSVLKMLTSVFQSAGDCFQILPRKYFANRKSREVVCRKVLRYKKLINREIVPWRVPKCAMSRICKQRAGRGRGGDIAYTLAGC